MARQLRTRSTSAKGLARRSTARQTVTLLGASLDLSGEATRLVLSRSSSTSSSAQRSDWQAIGGDFNRALSRAGSRREVT